MTATRRASEQKCEPPRLLAPDPERLAGATALGERAPVPAVVGSLAFGTAGWTDKTLLDSGRFYPKPSQSPEERLKFYAEHFRLVEVDATYYALLPPETSERWADWTPASFVFDVKAHPVLTGHPIDVRRLPADLKAELEATGQGGRVYPDKLAPELSLEIERRFREFLLPLERAGKLGCVLLQYPPWFTATRGNARRIEQVAERWQPLPLAVEFRHKSWLLPERRRRVFDLLREHGLVYVCVDEPEVERGGVPPIVEVTNPRLAVVRFHGHNTAGWMKQGATVHERFDYLYGPEELARWVGPLADLRHRAERTHAVFNNCVRNYAVLGAKGLAALLGGDNG